MAFGVNKVILVGTVGKDPEIRYTADGKAVAKLSMATSESWKDKEGTKVEETEWHNVVFFGKLAEIVGQWVKKGSKLFVEGKLKTHKWQDKETGKDRYSTNITGSSLQMLNKITNEAESQPQQSAHDDLDDIPF